ncbi:MAG: DUF4332 domain-containing protein [Candidatus Thorarchaeota archaeon]
MNEIKFRKFLKQKGKKNDVIERNISEVKVFMNFLAQKKLNQDGITTSDIDQYVESIEEKGKSAKGSLYVLLNYFIFLENKELYQYTRTIREERTKKSRKVFQIKDFLDINYEYINKLAQIGIKDVEQMLNAGKTKKQREKLSETTSIPEEVILELVKLSDISRVGYVRTKLSRLYYNAGIDSPLKLANYSAEELQEIFREYIEKSGWKGQIPFLADLRNNIRKAKTLPKVVEE